MSSTISPNPRRGEVWDVDFNPAVGAEIQKIRPAVVVSLNGIGRLPIKLVTPITDWKAQFSGRIWLINVKPTNTNGLTKESAVDTLQMKGVDIQRFHGKRGRLTASLMDEIGAAVAAIIGYQ